MLLLPPTSRRIRGVRYLAPGVILSCGEGGTVSVWDVSQASEDELFAVVGVDCYDVDFDPETRRVALACSDRCVRLVDIDRQEDATVIAEPFTAPVLSVRFLAGGSRLLAGSGFRVNDRAGGEVVLCSATASNTGTVLSRLEPGSRGAFDLDVSPDEGTVAVARSLCVILWEPVDGEEEVFRFNALSPNPKDMIPLGTSVGAVEFSPDGKTLAVTTGWKVRLYRVVDRTRLCELSHSQAVVAEAFTPDGRMVVTAARDRTVSLWETATGEKLTEFRLDLTRVAALAASPEGGTFALAAGRQIAVFDLPD